MRRLTGKAKDLIWGCKRVEKMFSMVNGKLHFQKKPYPFQVQLLYAATTTYCWWPQPTHPLIVVSPTIATNNWSPLPPTTGHWLPLYLPYAWPIVACLSIIDCQTLTKLAINCQPPLVTKHSRHHHWPLATTCLLSLIICPCHHHHHHFPP